MIKADLVKRARKCISGFDFDKKVSRTATNANNAVVLYLDIFYRTVVYKDNPSPDCDMEMVARVGLCGNCEYRLFIKLQEWLKKNK